MNTELAATTELQRDLLARRSRRRSRHGLREASRRGEPCRCSNGILLRGGEGTLTLASTDMEISLRASIAGEVSGDGAVVVPGQAAD